MNTTYSDVVTRLMDAFTVKDLATAVACFAEDAVFFDPHYPQPEMRGREAIAQGFQFSFQILEQPGFAIRQGWETAVNGTRNGALEVDTHHVLADGTELHFPQVFVYEVRNDLVARLQVYAPYPPPPSA
jgi:ketosteroid isomerase-like protein